MYERRGMGKGRGDLLIAGGKRGEKEGKINEGGWVKENVGKKRGG